MLVYVVERVYRDLDRPSSVMSVWSSNERAHSWAERQRAHNNDPDSSIAIRVTEVQQPPGNNRPAGLLPAS